jgi:hypothetical protein
MATIGLLFRQNKKYKRSKERNIKVKMQMQINRIRKIIVNGWIFNNDLINIYLNYKTL